MVEDNLYTVLPRINGVTLTFNSWQNELTRQGTLVFNIAGQASYRRLLKIMKVQVFICFKEKKEDVPAKKFMASSMRIFSSLRYRQESSKITALLHRKCTEGEGKIACEIPGIITYLQNWRYYRYYFAAVPTVLLEITKLRPGEEDFLREIIYQALLEYYGLSLSADYVELRKESCLLLDEEVETKEMEMKDEVEIKEVETSDDVYRNKQAEIVNKAIPKTSRTKKRQKNKIHPMFPPPDGPIFQFSAPARRTISYPTLPPHLEGDRIITFSHQQQYPLCEDSHEE